MRVREPLATASGAAAKVGRVTAALALQHLQRPRQERILFNSFYGRFSDNPRAIHEELAGRDRLRAPAWVATGSPNGLPTGAVPVAPYSLRYLRELGRSAYVVSNLQMPNNFRKRRGVTYLQTWHGTPLKRIGFDNERWERDLRGLRLMERDYRRWDFLISQNPFSTEIFRRAFRFDGEILEEGYPRNDILSDPRAGAHRDQVRADLGIRPGARVVLYAPTWRDNLVDSDGTLDFSLKLDLERMSERLGDDHVLLLRLHYMLAARLGNVVGAFGRNVSEHPDIRDLYLAADVLITDYSSAMFDFAVTQKPIVFFTHDLDEYRDKARGFYFDFEAEAPGPLCATTDEVISVLMDLDSVTTDHADRYKRFRQRFCPHDDGRAAARVVERVFGPAPG